MVTASRAPRWAEDSSGPAPRWQEDVQDAVEQRTAVRNAPSKPYFTDEYEPTDPELWARCLEVVNGERRWYTQSGRTINAPNDGRGYEHMPNPKGIAWAVKQYNGFGGGWKSRKEDVTNTAALRILAHGGVVVARPGELEDLKRAGLARVAGEAHGRVYWDVTVKGRRRFAAVMTAKEKV